MAAKSKKRGQMEMGFGMLFSIILIVVIAAVAFYAIWKFIDFKNCGQLGIFYNNLDSEVQKAWVSTGMTNSTFTGDLPSGVDYVCLGNRSSSLSGLPNPDPDKTSSLKSDIFVKYREDPANIINFVPLTSSCGTGTGSYNIKRGDIVIAQVDKFQCIKVENRRVSIRIEKKNSDLRVKLSRA